MLNTIKQTILSKTKKLKPFSESARIDIERLLCYVLNVSTSYLYTWPEKALSINELKYFNQLFAKRISGEPIAYLIGKQGFWNLDLIVSKHTLIPRADTEIIIEVILNKFQQQSSLSILDLGTGSGAIALALASEKKSWQVTAIECCNKALNIAIQNSKIYNLTNVKFLCGSWYQSIPQKKFDVIVSNPPYINQDDPALSLNVLQYEPRKALIADNMGLADIKYIIFHGKKHLTKSSFMILEHGFQQANSVANIFTFYGYQDIQHHIDLNRHIRATSAVLPLFDKPNE